MCGGDPQLPNAERLLDRLDSQLLVYLAEGLTDNVQFMPQLIHHMCNTSWIFQDLNALGIRIVTHSKWAFDCLCKLSIKIRKEKKELIVYIVAVSVNYKHLNSLIIVLALFLIYWMIAIKEEKVWQLW